MTAAAAVLALLLMAKAPPGPQITIYVGPMTRDGYVEIDEGVRDSVKDVRRALALALDMSSKNSSYRFVGDAALAQVALFVVSRGDGPPTGNGSAITIPGQVLTFANGQTFAMPSTTFQVAAKSRFVESVLRVNDYARPFVGDGGETWSVCAKHIAKDVATWMAANRARILSAP
jgi:hypothetical protein